MSWITHRYLHDYANSDLYTHARLMQHPSYPDLSSSGAIGELTLAGAVPHHGNWRWRLANTLFITIYFFSTLHAT